MTKRYGIVQVGSDDAPMFRTFDDGKEAGDWAKEKNQSFSFYGVPDRVRVIAYDDSEGEDAWKERERSRFADGTYNPLPVGFPSYPDHFAHISNDDPTKIAYVPNAMHGQADRHVRVRPGRYLEAMIGSSDTEIWIKDQARTAGFGPGSLSYFIRVATALYNRAVINDEVLFASTPDEIDDVYARGPSSCMSYEVCEYASRINGKKVRPVRVYGAGDLAVAYIVEGEDHIVARALCWPERRLYARIYGDEDRLRYALEKLGYDGGSMAGARMLRYPQNDGNQFIAPYLDRPCASCDDDGEFLIICEENEGEYDSGPTGLTSYAELYECVECGEIIDEDSVYYLDDAVYCEYHFCAHRAERARDTIPLRDELDEGVAVDIEVHNTHSDNEWHYVAISERAQSYFARRFFWGDRNNNYILRPETLNDLFGPNHNLTAVRVEE